MEYSQYFDEFPYFYGLIGCCIGCLLRGVAKTVVMCRHVNETVGFTEAHTAEWDRCGRGSPPPSGVGGWVTPPSGGGWGGVRGPAARKF